MKEVVKRLTPKPEVVRELFLKSGNQCAFPGCKQLIIDSDGNYISELCHIEAAMTGGERFNADQTNEQRRAFSNLLLMCHEHHVVTNNVEIWTVEKLKTIKSDHEAIYTNVSDKIISTLVDFTKTTSAQYPENLQLINELLDWKCEPHMLESTIKDINGFIDEIRKIPIKTRSVISIILERSQSRGGNLQFSPIEIEEACQIDGKELVRHISIIDSFGMLITGDHDDYGQQLFDLKNTVGWPLFEDIKTFCDKTGADISSFIEDLNFTLLDK